MIFWPATPFANFYPRPPRGGRPADVVEAVVEGNISIHALREEGDSLTGFLGPLHRDISIHALREEGDLHNGKGL